MRALRLLVIVLGVLLVGGTLALVGAIIVRSQHGAESRAAAPKGMPYDTVLDLPAGAVVQTLQTAGERLIVHIALPDGRGEIIVLDLDSGARRGTIELRRNAAP
jgi:Flp pilus assembly protein CpaB